MAQCLEGETLTHWALVAGVHVSFVSEVATYCHPSVRKVFCKLALAISEMGPRLTRCDTAELHEVERQFRFVKVIAPTLFEERKELFVEFYIVGW